MRSLSMMRAQSAHDEYYIEDDEDDKEEHVDPEELQAAMDALDEVEKKRKEERRREKGAVKLGATTTLQNAPAMAKASPATDPAADYVPTVSTWGVFERPKDISKTYGGGRTIQPGRSASREEQEKRRAEIQALVSQLKVGDSISPAIMVAAQNNLTAADRLLEKQNYAEAEYLFRSIRRQLPFRNKLAGKATLELGAVLDAQGRYMEAAELYKSLTKHPDTSIRKNAIRLSESFEALQYFRFTNQSTDRTWSDTIRPLLRSFADRSSVAFREYHATAQDLLVAKQTQQASYFVLAALFLVPMATVALLSTVAYE